MLGGSSEVLDEPRTTHDILISEQTRDSEYSLRIQVVSTLDQLWSIMQEVEGVSVA
jgi:hypothetical protein